ncbi:extracellular solute-binding protein [Cohnella sp. GCM10020058]|uniref:extracellular solute-binding protein n=1 Tax=Cohnella sp. GCM10020058 TaxID=3317330 RepID=UPI00363D8CB8
MTNRPKRTTFKTRMDDMLAALANDIATGKYKQGELLPSEIALGEAYRLSKKSVRKALDTLVDQGYIEKQPRVGARVLAMNPANRTIVKFGYYPSLVQDANLNALIDAFHARYPQIRVEMIPLPFNQHSPTMRESMEREAIDLVTVNLQNYELFLDQDSRPESFEPLSPIDGIYPFLTKPFTADGTLYVQPFVFSPIVLCYNKRHFQEAGMSEPDSGWTWTDVARANESLSRGRDRLGFLFNLASANRWPLFLLQEGFKFRTGPDGKTIYRDAHLERCLENCLGYVDDHLSSLSMTDEEVSERLFVHQKASMIVTSYFRMNALRESGLDFDISPLPYTKEARTLLVVIGLAINKYGASKEAAKTLMDFLLSQASQLSIRRHTLSIPSMRSAAEHREHKDERPLRFHMYRDIIPTFHYHGDLNATFSLLSRMSHELTLYWTKMEDAETILQRLEDMEKPASETERAATLI